LALHQVQAEASSMELQLSQLLGDQLSRQ